MSGDEGPGDELCRLVRSCARSGDISRAEEALQLAAPEDVTVEAYNAIIHVCTQAADMERAEMYFRQMEDRRLEPTVVTYNLVINACARVGDSTRAEDWLIHMIGRSLPPNLVTLGTLCKCFARHGEVQKIEDMIVSLERSSTPPNEYFYASLICACGACEPPDVERAERAFTHMVSLGLRAQSVKRVLRQVIGRQRSQQLLEQLRWQLSTTMQAGSKGKGRGAGPPSPRGRGRGSEYSLSDLEDDEDDEEPQVPVGRTRRRGRGREVAGSEPGPPPQRAASSASIALAAPWLWQSGDRGADAAPSYRRQQLRGQQPPRGGCGRHMQYPLYPPLPMRHPWYTPQPWQPPAWVMHRDVLPYPEERLALAERAAWMDLRYHYEMEGRYAAPGVYPRWRAPRDYGGGYYGMGQPGPPAYGRREREQREYLNGGQDARQHPEGDMGYSIFHF